MRKQGLRQRDPRVGPPSQDETRGKALQEYSDNMAVEVWRKMEPIVKLVHVMKGKVDNIVGRASNSE